MPREGGRRSKIEHGIDNGSLREKKRFLSLAKL